MTAPAAALAALCASVGVASTARRPVALPPGVTAGPVLAGVAAPTVLERAATIARSLIARRDELETARTYRLAMEALERRRIAIIQARSPRLCAACAGSRRQVDDDGLIARCGACEGAGVTA